MIRLVFFFFCSFPLFGYSDTVKIVGKIFDKETKKPIPGARVQILNSNKGTYSSSSGLFKLSNVQVGSRILVQSIGYENASKEASFGLDTMFIYLLPSPVKLKEVEKVGEIEADEIIRRAIKRKRDNLDNLKTLQAQVYSKLFLELGGVAFESFVDSTFEGRMLKARAKLNKNEDSLGFEYARNFILETFSNTYIDYANNVKFSEITQRRQTANIPNELNQIVFSDFLSFYDETVKIVSTEFVTPLSDDAFKYYSYELINKESYGNLYVYNLKVVPKTKLYPTFTGTMKILEKNYNLLEIDLVPSENSTIDFFKGIRYLQKFTNLSENIWQPTFLEVSGVVNVIIIKGFLDFDIKFRVVSILSDALINQPLPDTILDKARVKDVVINQYADSTSLEFWENNSLVETTEEERKIYQKVDTISKKVKLNSSDVFQTSQKGLKFGIDFSKESGYNRVNGYTIGILPYIEYHRLKLGIEPMYSFAQKKFFYEASFDYFLSKTLSTKRSQLTFSVFSKPTQISLDRNMLLEMNSIFAYFFHWDYYDYFKKEGFKIEYKFENQEVRPYLKMSLGYENSHHSSLEKKTDWSLFSKSIWRENPSIFPNKFDLFQLSFSVSTNPELFGFVIGEEKFAYKLAFDLLVGKMANHISFGAISPKLFFQFPTFYTGYNPMLMKILFEIGIATDYTPPQFEFKMPNAWGFGNFLTAPTCKYGGKRFIAIHLKHNFSDFLWRVIGLPTIGGRGFELSADISMGLYSNYGNYQLYDATEELFFEFGFGLSRLPVFVTNLVFWSVDVKYNPKKEISKGFGFSLNLALPF